LENLPQFSPAIPPFLFPKPTIPARIPPRLAQEMLASPVSIITAKNSRKAANAKKKKPPRTGFLGLFSVISSGF
jgi:hypothetical protein